MKNSFSHPKKKKKKTLRATTDKFTVSISLNYCRVIIYNIFLNDKAITFEHCVRETKKKCRRKNSQSIRISK